MTRWEVDPESRNGLLIRCVGHDYGPNPIERLDDIRRDRMRYASTIAEWLSIDPNDIVLDLGSGCGFMGRAIAPVVRHLHCADISPKFLAFCTEELAEFPNVTTHLVSYADLSSLRSAGITKIYSSAVFIHFNFYDIVIYLNALSEILPIGGTVFFDFLDPAGITKARQSLFHRHLSYYFLDRTEIATLIQYNSLETVRAAAEMTGFRCQKIWQMSEEAYAAILTKEEPDAIKPMSRGELDRLEQYGRMQSPDTAT
jgi:cyclopropane fatty-acyl-phospholipid synthase-like methyltransferase